MTSLGKQSEAFNSNIVVLLAKLLHYTLPFPFGNKILIHLKHFRKPWIIAPQRPEGGRCRAQSLFLMRGAEDLAPRTVRTDKGKSSNYGRGADFISSHPSLSCYLGPHLQFLEARLSSAVPPPVTALTSSQKSRASSPWLTGAQLSRAAGGWKKYRSEGLHYCCCRWWKINSWAPEKGLFFSCLRRWKRWGKFKSNNLVVAFLLPGVNRWVRQKVKLGKEEKAEKKWGKSRLIAVGSKCKSMASGLPKRAFHQGVNSSSRRVVCEVILGRN